MYICYVVYVNVIHTKIEQCNTEIFFSELSQIGKGF